METMLSTTTPGPVPVSRYQLLEKLGEGGMAEVFRAEMRAMGGFSRIVALKLVRAHLSFHPDFNRWFMREAKVGGILAHPNLVETLDYGVLQDRPFIAMEYVEGPSLESLLERQARLGEPFPLDVALQILVQICRGLDYAHQATDHDGVPLELVHRDLKPSNILISRFGTAKVADFGVARAGSRLANTPSASVIRGTLQYMSPEQAWGRNLDHRSDLFSLGLILFELLTLEPFYVDEGAPAVLRRAQDAELDRRLERLETAPCCQGVLPILTRAMAREPEGRYGTAGELGDALEALLYQLPQRTRLGEWVGEIQGSSVVKAVPVGEAREEVTVQYAPLTGISGPVSGARGRFGESGNEARVPTIPALPALPISDIWPAGRPALPGGFGPEGRGPEGVGPALRWRGRHTSAAARRVVRRLGMVALGLVIVGLTSGRIKALFPGWESAEGADRAWETGQGRSAPLAGVAPAKGGAESTGVSQELARRTASHAVEGAPGLALTGEPRGAGPGDVEARGVESRGVEERGVEARGVEARGVEARDVEPPPQAAPGPPPPGRGGQEPVLRGKRSHGSTAASAHDGRERAGAYDGRERAGAFYDREKAAAALSRGSRAGALVAAASHEASTAVSPAAMAGLPGPGALASLALNSYPQTSIRVDGSLLDQFPVLKLPLPAGEHTLSFSLGPGRELVRKVTVRPGAMMRCTAWFEQGRIQCRED